MSRNTILATYHVECRENLKLSKAAQLIADRQSIGIFEPPRKLPEGIDKFRARPYHKSTSTNRVTIEFPIENIDTTDGNIPALLSYIAGDLFGYECFENIRLEDIELPEKLVRLFPGPKFGPEGIRKIMEVKEKRPLFGVTIKPCVGITPNFIAQKSLLAAEHGADFITDDEKLINPSHCTLERRAKTMSEILRKVESKYGKKLLYIINISHSADKIRSMAIKALRCPQVGLMVCFITGGFGCIQTLAEDKSVDAPIWAHRTMHAAFTRNPQHGININVIAKLCRLAGADFQHVGPIGGIDKIVDGVRGSQHIGAQRDIMAGHWFDLKSTLPTITGGAHPGTIETLVKLLGPDIAFAVGTAVFNHPGGFEHGVKAMKQAIDAVMAGIPTLIYAENHPELMKALETWGYVDPKKLGL